MDFSVRLSTMAHSTHVASVLERQSAVKWFFFLCVLLFDTDLTIEAVSEGSLLHGSALLASGLRYHSSYRIHDALAAIRSAKVEPHSPSDDTQKDELPSLHIPSVAEPRRQLLEEQNRTCAWDDETSSCSFSGSAVFHVLEQTDNPVSNYLQDVLVRYDMMCPSFMDRCSEVPPHERRSHMYRKRLQMVSGIASIHGAQIRFSRKGSSCDISHEIFREFTSVDCLSNISYLVEEDAGMLECSALLTEGECQTAERCTW